VGDYDESWKELRPQIDGIVCRTPTLSKNETTPIVLLHGFMAGHGREDAVPTVVIMCRSAAYAKQIEKEICDSGLLDRYKFRMKILDGPIDTDPRTGPVV